MTNVFLSLGSNMGDKKAYLEKAITSLKNLPQTTLLGVSSFYQTVAWGKTDQDDFINAVCQIDTCLEPHDLLKQCQAIEKRLGRERHEHWGPRTMDIDLLLYGSETIDTADLTVPHPYMTQRAFVLVPLAEIAPDLIFPKTNQTVSSLLSDLVTDDVVKI